MAAKISGLLAQSRGHRRDKRRIAQFRGMVPLGHGHQPDRIERAVNDKQIVLAQAEVFQQQGANFQRTAVLDLQAHGVALAAVAQFGFHGLSRVAASSSSV